MQKNNKLVTVCTPH